MFVKGIGTSLGRYEERPACKSYETYSIDMVKIEKVICYVKENYIRNHIARYGEWPPYELLASALPALAHAHHLGIDPNTPRHVAKFGPTPIDAYSSVELLPNMRFSML